MARTSRSGIVYGLGVNDAGYTVQVNEGSKLKWICPFYKRWKSMLQRALSDKYKQRVPTYINTRVCDDWLLFSNFKSWMENQNWEGLQLDKDYLSDENIYSPETCVFIPQYLNVLFTDAASIRGNHPIGVTFNKKSNDFQMKCNDGKGGRVIIDGFKSESDAHISWLINKISVVEYSITRYCLETYVDQRVVKVLVDRIGQFKDQLGVTS